MENLKKQILSGIPTYNPDAIEWHGIEEFEELIYEKDGFKIYGDAIQAALDKYKCILIDKRERMYVDKPIIMKSGYRLKLDRYQEISNLPDARTCIIRNENIINADFKRAVHENFDTDISVDGGIWDGGLKAGDGEDKRLKIGPGPQCKGDLSIMIFVNIENLVLGNAEFKNGGINYGVQLGSVKGFHISNLTYIGYGRDGVHVNGPASYGEICNLYGKDMGDDMVALNAWDWDTSAVTFGTIEYIYVHENQSSNNESRLLPGRKMYDEDYVDCDIKNCILEKLSGIYTFKIYCQPNIFNAEIDGYHDVSGAVGNISNVWFYDIDVDENKSKGFHDLPVNGVFDICADCHDLHFENIRVHANRADLEKAGIKLVSVGPLSAVWTNGSENPDDWGEVFDPDAICHVDDIYFKNITFKDGKADAREDLTKEIKMTINPDYPRTKPKGGTGYGVLGNVYID